MRPQQGGHLGHSFPHNAEFSTCEVVLVQGTNLLEQVRSDIIVKVLTGQFFARILQPVEHLVAKGVALRLKIIKLE